MNSKNLLNSIVAILTVIAVVLTAFCGVLSLDDDDFIGGFLIGAPLLALCINYYIANEFHNIAEKKDFLIWSIFGIVFG